MDIYTIKYTFRPLHGLWLSPYPRLCQCLSNKLEMEVAEMTFSGKEFQSLLIWLEKKFWVDAKEIENKGFNIVSRIE